MISLKLLPFFVFLTLATLLSGIPVNAIASTPILQGSVSFNAVENLYTYEYEIDNTNGSWPIRELGILVDSAIGWNTPDLWQEMDFEKIPHTSPEGYKVVKGLSGDIENPPISIIGTIWNWDTISLSDPIPVGAKLSGFSFTVPFAPANGTGNNYFIYSTSAQNAAESGIVEYGRVVAPDFLGRYVPEPSVTALIGPILLGMFARRKKTSGKRRPSRPNTKRKRNAHVSLSKSEVLHHGRN